MRYAAPFVASLGVFVACVGSDPGAASSSSSSSSGTPSGPILSVADSDLDFGAIMLGNESAPLAITVTNSGSSPLESIVAAIDGPDLAAFGIKTNDCATLAAGASCAMAVAFLAKDVGPSSATLNVTAGAASHAVKLRGVGTAAKAIQIDPPTKDFGLFSIDKTSPPQVLSVTNVRGTSLGNVKSVHLSDPTDFTIASDACTGAAMGPTASCSVSVAFTPKSSGTKTATLEVTTESGDVGVANLAGTGGVPAELTLSVPSLPFGDVPDSKAFTKSFTITNTGNVPTAKAITASVTAEPLSVLTTDCVTALAPGASCSVTIQLLSTTPFVFNTTVTIDAGAGVTVSLPTTGAVKLKPAIVAGGNGGPSTFGAVGVGKTRTWYRTFRSDGAFETGALTVALTGAQWSVISDGCTGKNLGPKTTATDPFCEVDIQYAPTAEGASTATLTVTSASGASVVAIQADAAGPVCTKPGDELECAPKMWCSSALGCSAWINPGEVCPYYDACQYGCHFGTPGALCCTKSSPCL